MADSSLLKVRKKLGGLALRQSLTGLAGVVGRLPIANPARHDVEVVRDVPYLRSGLVEHTCDIWRPKHADGPLPLCVYVHGGAFRALSKDTHWIMGLQLARRGLCVVVPNYRLAPQHRYPAGSADVAASIAFARDHARRFGGDIEHMALLGESAGANIALGLAVGRAFDVPARHLDCIADVDFNALVPMCGVFQVGDAGRFRRADQHFHWFYNDRVEELEAWLPRHDDGSSGVEDPVASPLPFLEQMVATNTTPKAPLPPMSLPVGGGDFLVDDHRRLQRALTALGVDNDMRVYGREPHAFHAFVWRKEAQRCWADTFDFLDAHNVPTTPAHSKKTTTTT